MTTPWQRLNQLSEQSGISHNLIWKRGQRPTNTQILRAINNIEYELEQRVYPQQMLQIDAIQPVRRRDKKQLARGKPEIKLMRNYPLYGGDANRSIFQWTNPLAMNKKTFLEIVNRFSTHASLRFPVQYSDGRVEFKTVKAKNLKKLAQNNFSFNTREIGSDADYAEDAVLDFSRPFIITETKQRSQLKGSCNSQKETIKTLTHCIVIDPYTRNKNCGFACLKKLGFTTDVKLKDQGPISPKDLLKICERNMLPVEIILDEIDENNQLKSVGKSQTTGMVPHKKIVFSMKNNIPHYYVYHDRCESKEERKEKNKEQFNKNKEFEKKLWVLVFYDLETVFDNNDDYLAKTYSCSYFPILLSQFDKKITKENIEYYKRKCKFIEGEDVCAKMVDSLCNAYDTSKYRFKFISFNGSNFDDYFLLKQAMKCGENVHATFQSKSILGLTFQYGQCWDLRKFLTIGSLQALCQSFGVYPQKIDGFSHKTIQYQYEDNETILGWDMFKTMIIQDIEEYNKYDVLALYSLTQKFRDLIKELTKTDVFDHQTIGSHSYNLCQSKWDESMKNLLSAPLTEEDDLFIRKCLTAGRCQVMNKEDGQQFTHITKKRLSMVDVVSLYPTMMISEDCFYPAGTYQYVKIRDRKKLGFYQIIVQQREDLPNILPKRDYTNPQIPLDWDNKTEYETFCTSIDLDVLEQFGNNYRIIQGLEFSHKISGIEIFQSLLPFKQEKIKQDIYKEIYAPAGEVLYNQAMREVCKIYLNSLSGKVIQRNFDNVTKIIRSRRELHKFLNECQDGTASLHFASQEFAIGNGKKMIEKRYDTKRAKPSYLGVYIYAHARRHMYENIYSKTNTKYTDTDSALMSYEEELKLRQQVPHLFQKTNMTIDGMQYQIKDFGTLDCELKANANEAILIRPKCYFVGNRAENYVAKLKCKGISFKGDNCRYVPDNHSHKTISKLEFDNIKETLYSNPFKVFDDLMNKGSVKVACEQLIVKSLRQDNAEFGIALRHIIKEIKITDDETELFNALMNLSDE